MRGPTGSAVRFPSGRRCRSYAIDGRRGASPTRVALLGPYLPAAGRAGHDLPEDCIGPATEDWMQ